MEAERGDGGMQKEVAMNVKKRGPVPEERMKRCIFASQNCRMKDDGTWDCSTRFKDCLGVHSNA